MTSICKKKSLFPVIPKKLSAFAWLLTIITGIMRMIKHDNIEPFITEISKKQKDIFMVYSLTASTLK